MDFPRGSEWRKWDLHLHTPGTKLGDVYSKSGNHLDWEQFCQIIHESDVSAFGITDYFSFEAFFEFKRQYEAFFPKDKTKVFFPNLELRLPEVLNDAGQSVNIHLLFRPDLSKSDANKLLMALGTETTVGRSKKTVFCADLKSNEEFQSATVSRKSLQDALERIFGSATPLTNNVLLITSAKGDGIRPGGAGSKKRKYQLVDEIDKSSDGFFGNPTSRQHFLDVDRLESDEKIMAKPVFGGCDAHNFDDLKSYLGKHSTSGGASHHITWVKADLTYEGLLQTLIEPDQRVAIQPTEPDLKQPYQYIAKVRFSGSKDFPAEVVFNKNLNSIIGSRSSGKSALLAFIAHAVDAEETIQQQIDASGLDSRDVGPAAGKSWSDVSSIKCEVEWASEEATTGKVIYIPQNSLYTISEHPDQVTAKIAPSLFRKYPEFKVAYDQALDSLQAANEDIRAATVVWFATADDIERLSDEIEDLGDKPAILAARDALQARINTITQEAHLTDTEIAKYQGLATQLDESQFRLNEIETEVGQLSPYGVDAATRDGIAALTVDVDIAVRPTSDRLPDGVASKIAELTASAAAALKVAVENELTLALTSIRDEKSTLNLLVATIHQENAELIAKNQANAELVNEVANHKKQLKTLREIDKREKDRTKRLVVQTGAAKKVADAVAIRNEVLASLNQTFCSEVRTLDKLSFGIEVGIDPAVGESLSTAFNRNKIGPYIPAKGDNIDFKKAQSDPAAFLSVVQEGSQALNKGNLPDFTSQAVLMATPEIRFSAELDEDKIGGFGRSSMTPGKQALFALSLILNESQEPWPLLIDQPEDDLDSRSIYDTIVPYICERKRERQIIMVSHNANLVIGADSEEVIVANRHGVDRPNRAGQTFEYLSGSLEHSQKLNRSSATVLGAFGIREHACELLDGGEEAFQKRKDKYKI